MTDMDASSDRVVLGVPGKGEYLDLIRSVVTAVANQMGFDEDGAIMIEMAVDEACANVIEHGYSQMHVSQAPKDKDEKPVDLDLYIFIQPDRITITIADRGSPFSPLEYESQDITKHLQEGKSRGLGIYIIKKFMDEVEHTPMPQGGNRLRLVKYLHPVEKTA